MTKRSIARRWRARLDGERGFTILETVIAITVMFSLLVSLAYVVTSSFTYQRYARMRQTATGLANQMMEEVRGLPYDTLKKGLSSTDLSGDPNIVSCSGVSTLYACNATPGSAPGTGEPIVTSAGLSNTEPLVPHRSSTSPNTNRTIDGVSYAWAAYVSQAPTVAATSTMPAQVAPYRVTVKVAYTQGAVAKSVSIQSLFWSPTGCRSTATHPYAAPCQPFFYGEATIPSGAITIVPTAGSVGLNNSEFDKADISLPGVSASAQQEQVVQSLAQFRLPAVGLTTDNVATTYGGAVGASSADSDPSTSSTTYQRSRCGVEITCSAVPPQSSPSNSSSDRITVALPATTTAESDAATAASSTSAACPPTNVSATTENDGLACAGAGFVQSGSVTAMVTLGGTSPAIPSFLLAKAQEPAAAALAPLRAFANRVTNPATTGCSPAANTDGCLAMSASRTVGTISLGALPAGIVSPGTNWNGWFVQLTNYADSASVAVGDTAPVPSVSANPPGGTLTYFDPTANSYASVALNSASIATLAPSLTASGTVGGQTITAVIGLDSSQAVNASSSTSATPASGTTTRTVASAQVVAPVVVVRYRLYIGAVATSNKVLDLSTTVNLGALDVDASYSAKPAAGS